MNNNNTADVAYLGTFNPQNISVLSNYKFDESSPINVPVWESKEIDEVMLFDCKGTRYVFKIKELKKQS